MILDRIPQPRLWSNSIKLHFLPASLTTFKANIFFWQKTGNNFALVQQDTESRGEGTWVNLDGNWFGVLSWDGQNEQRESLQLLDPYVYTSHLPSLLRIGSLLFSTAWCQPIQSAHCVLPFNNQKLFLIFPGVHDPYVSHLPLQIGTDPESLEIPSQLEKKLWLDMNLGLVNMMVTGKINKRVKLGLLNLLDQNWRSLIQLDIMQGLVNGNNLMINGFVQFHSQLQNSLLILNPSTGTLPLSSRPFASYLTHGLPSQSPPFPSGSPLPQSRCRWASGGLGSKFSASPQPIESNPRFSGIYSSWVQLHYVVNHLSMLVDHGNLLMGNFGLLKMMELI